MTFPTTALEELHRRILAARRPEDLFGSLPGCPAAQFQTLRQAFAAMVHAAHPDHNPAEQRRAAETLNLLLHYRDRAEERITAGTYGTVAPANDPIVIAASTGTYHLHEPVYPGDYANLYPCSLPRHGSPRNLVFKIVRHPADNALAACEARALQTVAGTPGRCYFPQLVDAFLAADGASRRQALIYATPRATRTAQQIRTAYVTGLDPRDAAWIFNRLLEALWHAHAAGLIHAAVVPPNLLLDVSGHGLVLAEWGYSVEPGGALRAISGHYEAWYPPEVFAKEPATPATDIAMAARCLVYLLGGDPLTGHTPPAVPAALRQFITGCLLSAPTRRPRDAGALREEFDDLLLRLYGPRTFRPLAMPA